MIINLYRQLFLFLWSLLGFFGAIVGISVIVSMICLPLYAIIGKMVAKENELQGELYPLIDELKRKYADDSASYQAALERLYGRYQYNPFLAIRKVLPLFVALPFLFLTYYMLEGTEQLNGVAFLCFKDVGKSDGLLWGVNFLPFVMTGINLLTAFATPGLTKKDRNQAIFIALFFLVFLYTANAALMIYWCLNQFFNLLRSLYIDHWNGARHLLSQLRLGCRYLKTESVLAYFCCLSFLFSVYLRFMILTLGWGPNHVFATRGLGVVASFLIVLTYCLSRGRVKKPVFVFLNKAILFVSVLVMAFFAIIECSTFFCDALLKFEIHVINVKVVWAALTGLWIVQLVVLYKDSGIKEGILVLKQILARILSGWPLLAIVVCLAMHFSCSSRNFDVPAISICKLAIQMLLPCISLALVTALAFRRWLKIQDVVFLSMSAVLGAYLIPTISRESGPIFGYDCNLPLRFAFICGIMFFVRLLGQKRMMTPFAVLIILVAILRIFLPSEDDEGGDTRALTFGGTNSPGRVALEQVNCVRSNSVYLLVYDSYAHDSVLRKYNVRNLQMGQWLMSRGFSRYDAYSIGGVTVESMGNAFAIGGVRTGSLRSMLAGNNLFDDFLHRSNYRTSYVLCGWEMPRGDERMPGDFYFPSSQQITRPERVLWSCIRKGYLSQSATTFNAYAPKEWLDVKRRILESSPPTASFVYAHSDAPGHATLAALYRKGDAFELREYEKCLAAADAELREDIEMLLKKDDDSIIIVASDHGPYLHEPEGDGFNAMDLLDRCGVQLLIRWPNDYQPCIELDCLQNVMLEVMIYLSGDRSLSQFVVDGETSELHFPKPIPAGAIRNGIIRKGMDAGKGLFDAAAALVP